MDSITIKKANINDVMLIHSMQIKAFKPLLEKYKDYHTNPGNETLERIIERMNQPFTDYYLIYNHNTPIGSIRIIKMKNSTYRISPIFILPEYQGKGIAQTVFRLIEGIYHDAILWKLDTILEEVGHCYLYEKLGYQKTGQLEKINGQMTIVYYEKRT